MKHTKHKNVRNTELQDFLFDYVKKFNKINEIRAVVTVSINLINLVWRNRGCRYHEIQVGCIGNNRQRETAITIEETQRGMADKSHNGILLSARARSLIIQERILVR